jgi:hypothetical protein
MKRTLIYFAFLIFCVVGCKDKSDYDKIKGPKISIDNAQYQFLYSEVQKGKHIAVYHFKNEISYALFDSSGTRVEFFNGKVISHEDFLQIKSTKEEITSIYYENADVLEAISNIMKEGPKRKLVIYYEEYDSKKVKEMKPSFDAFDENGTLLPGGGNGGATPVKIPAP